MSAITPLHVERGQQMRSIIEHDIAEHGLTFESAAKSLATFLGIDREAVLLAVAIANEADKPGQGILAEADRLEWLAARA